jgi:hypothetical protein
MISRDVIRRLERLEARLGTKRSRLQFRIRFVEPGGRSVSTLLLEEGGRQEWLDQEVPGPPPSPPPQDPLAS